MPRERLQINQRKSQIIDATIAILEESGIEECTMSAIASRSNISRVWLYNFFDDLEEVLIAVWDSGEGLYFYGPGSPPPRNVKVSEIVRDGVDRSLNMPLGLAMVGAWAMIGATPDRKTVPKLNEAIWQRFEETWIVPLLPGGTSRDRLVGAVATMHASTIGIVLAMHESRIRREAARTTLEGVVELVVDPTWEFK